MSGIGDAAAEDRLARLREAMANARTPMDVIAPRFTDLALHQRDLQLDEVRMWSMEFRPVAFHRSVERVRQADPETYNVCLLQNGEMTHASARREVTYGPGEILVHDSSRPFSLRADSANGSVACVGIEIPKAMVALSRDKADRVVGQRIPGREGVGALLAGFLTQLTTDVASYRPADVPRLAVVAADLVSAVFSHVAVADDEPPAQSHRQVLTLRIKAFIRSHLGDPGLTRDAIAAAHHISTSYLHRLFQDAGVGVMTWIRQQRLEHARRDLANPEWNAAPIHQIATRWGFIHHADFTRAFRNAYRLPPSEYRRSAQRLPAAPG